MHFYVYENAEEYILSSNEIVTETMRRRIFLYVYEIAENVEPEEFYIFMFKWNRSGERMQSRWRRIFMFI
jgi:hypothetical protein